MPEFDAGHGYKGDETPQNDDLEIDAQDEQRYEKHVEAIKETFRRILNRAGTTLEYLEFRSGISMEDLRRYAQAERNLSRPQIQKIAKILGVDPQRLDGYSSRKKG